MPSTPSFLPITIIGQKRNKERKFTAQDLSRLEYEVKKLDHLEKMIDTLKLSRALAKCIIPIFGLIWAYKTEIKATDSKHSSAIGTNKKIAKAQEALNWHIASIENANTGLQQRLPKKV
ncbi:hypothetical protein PHSC3_000755 [Chlamydiales bacterium STE3]|nr:hypothetical protein PHSC3_000755 [Chlamydiales bacterium STE3]